MAGYGKPRQAGARALSNVVIASRVRDRIQCVAMTANEVLEELKRVAYIPVDGDPKSVQNKVRALELLGKYHGLFTNIVDDRRGMSARQRAELAIQEFIKRTGRTKEDAIKYLEPHIPQISKLVH